MGTRVADPEALQLLHEGAKALAWVEANGIRVNTDYLDRTIKQADQDIADLTASLQSTRVYRIWVKRHGAKATLGSREQLADVLFDGLNIPYPVSDYTATKRYRTDDAVLAKVDHPFVRDYRRLLDIQKDRSTYLEGIRREVVDGYFHPTFNLHTASTFRSSSGSDREDTARGGRDLNFQNLPIRDPARGAMIRKAFIPRKGWRLVEVDFSGVEVRVAACYNLDPVLIRYIQDPTTDMHRDTACQLFGLKPEEVDKRTTRDWSKNRFVFPQFYGSVYFQCAPSLWEGVTSNTMPSPGLGITVKEHLANQGITELGACDAKGRPKPGTFERRCKDVEDDFWINRFTVYAQWKRDFYKAFQKNGGFKTLTGFWIGALGTKGEGILKKNDVTNFPVQGSAFHCLLWSLTQLVKWIRKHKLKSRVLGQIHDSILLDCPDNELQDVLNAARRIMTVDLPKAWKWLIVPLDTESDVTPVDGSWFEKSQWVQTGGVWGLKPK